MKKLTFRGVIIAATICFGLLTTLVVAAHLLFPVGWLLSCAISFGTTFYHFAMRLLVGSCIPNAFNHRSAWFQPSAFENKLYRLIRVKKWKDRIPTYDPRLFSMKENTPEQIANNMCQAEVVHEVIILLSFVPMLFAIPWGSFFVFLITSVLAAALDTVFVILQRYNRPRLVRLINKYKSRRCPS